MNKFFMVLLACVLVLSGCATSTSDTSMQTQETVVELGETSFDLSLATFEYDKEQNDLLIEYDTGLPDQTEVIIGINPGFPSGDQYDNYGNYTTHLMREVHTIVKDGKISYNITDQEFGTYKLPSGTYYLRVVIPMSETKNPSFYQQIETEEDFLAIYPNAEFSEEQPTEYSFFDRDEEVERWIYFYDESVSLENAHSLDEIQNSFTKVDYREIDKNPSKFEGERVEFTGTVLEIHESRESLEGMLNYHAYLRLDVGVNDVVYVDYYSALGTDGLYEDDVVTLQGRMTGSETYESVAGHQITIPSMEAMTFVKQ